MKVPGCYKHPLYSWVAHPCMTTKTLTDVCFTSSRECEQVTTNIISILSQNQHVKENVITFVFVINTNNDLNI